MERNRRIVLADASRECLTLLKAALTQAEDCTVYLCLSGEEALRTIRRTRPDLAVLDVLLPGMSGLEVLRRLRQEAGAVPAVLCLSSVTSLSLHEQIGRLGAGLLYKPVTAALLLQEVRRLCPSPGARAPLPQAIRGRSPRRG